jgi:hypothetical protein
MKNRSWTLVGRSLVLVGRVLLDDGFVSRADVNLHWLAVHRAPTGAPGRRAEGHDRVGRNRASPCAARQRQSAFFEEHIFFEERQKGHENAAVVVAMFGIGHVAGKCRQCALMGTCVVVQRQTDLLHVVDALHARWG